MNETNNTNKKKVISVLGPTASGKTAVAIEIAKKFNGVIIMLMNRFILWFTKITGAPIGWFYFKKKNHP